MYIKLLKASSFTLCFCLLLSLTGCWDVEEVNRRGTANTLFFDVGTTANTKMGVSAHIPGTVLPPVGATEQQFEKRYFTLSAEGNGALDAWRNLQTNAARNLFFGQISALILSEKFVRQGDLNNSLDFIGRLRSVNSTVNLLVTKSNPEQLVDIKINNNIIPGTYISNYLQAPSKKMLAIPITLWQAFRVIDSKTADVFLPMIETSQGQYLITGTALFSRNSMVGELDMYETGTLALLRGVQDGYLTIPLPGVGVLSLSNVAAKSKIVPLFDQQENLAFDIKIKMTATIGETIPRKEEVTAADKKRYKDLVEEFTTAQISNLLTKLQQLNSDPVGFGGHFRVNYPQEWEQLDWHQLYPTARFSISTDVNLKTTGTIR